MNISQVMNPSTTFTIGITSTYLSTLTGGYLVLRDSSDLVKFNSIDNFFDTTANSTFITFCAPASQLHYCHIDTGDSSLECDYELYIESNDHKDSYFQSSDITEAFPGTNLYVVQNAIPPQLTQFTVSVHPQGPLVSIELDITIFGSGLKTLTLTYKSLQDGFEDDQSFIDYRTSNGLYYLEFLVKPDVHGTFYVITDLHIDDIQGNSLQLTTNQLQQQFGVSTFNVSKSSYPQFDNLFQYLQNNASQTLFSNQFNLWTYDIELYSYRFPILNAHSTLGSCASYYINSTSVQLYCNIPPNFGTYDSSITWVSESSYLEQNAEVSFLYENKDIVDPVITSIQFSVDSIDKLAPFYIELNYTFSTSGSYLKKVNPYIYGNPDVSVDQIQGNTNNLSSGVVSGYYLFDSSSKSLTAFTVYIEDSKDFENSIRIAGPPTTQRYVQSDMTLKAFYEETVFDFTNNSIVYLPFVVTTQTNAGNQLIFSQFEYSDIQHMLNSGTTNFYQVNGGLLNTSEINSVYSTWVQMTPISLAEHDIYAGDILLSYTYKTNSGDDDDYEDPIIYFSRNCFTIIPPSSQPTLVTSFIVTPSGPIDTTTTESVSINFQTKGTNVINAAISFLYTDDQTDIGIEPINCTIVQSYSYETLMMEYNCEIPVFNMPSTTLFYQLKLNIGGIPTTIFNAILQNSGYPSYIEINGPQDNGLVPQIQQFATSQTNGVLTVEYTLTNPSNFQFEVVDFIFFNRYVPWVFDTEIPNMVSIQQPQLNGSFTVDLCNIPGFTKSFQGNFGIYISIKSPIPGVNWQFPYEVLTALDPNQQQFESVTCDYSGPRLVSLGVFDPQPSYDTTSQGYNITLQFQITDDLSGFEYLSGQVRSNNSESYFWQDFSVSSSDIASGNINNGIYEINWYVPQYTNGQYVFEVSYLVDSVGNERPYTLQNCLLLSTGSLTIDVTSQVSNPNLPVIQSIASQFVGTNNNITVQIEGDVVEVELIIITDFGLNTNVYLQPIGGGLFSILYYPYNIISGQYYFNICLTSSSMTTHCYSFLDLYNFGLLNNLYLN
ncbi:hypothetical protein DLAC_06273 [Tieghemostelium lacteum]|uniref:DUF7743 domain-containing protein n=1 Tax=Tieghemostelium lacteum TaxID=361077 RepID=A0A151ZEH3_TIELA|nr:hypothetical protein DLAC_06273 [Tieghemostelium lacteum]|eukprot:KYQ92310.1 hypothetical protein DLAC_06273 [Tieghemostelium lacteum]